MAPAVKELERAIIGCKLGDGGHPILRWNIENIAVETNKVGNRGVSQSEIARDRIDGAVACAMAVTRASFGYRSMRFTQPKSGGWADLHLRPDEHYPVLNGANRETIMLQDAIHLAQVCS